MLALVCHFGPSRSNRSPQKKRGAYSGIASVSIATDHCWEFFLLIWSTEIGKIKFLFNHTHTHTHTHTQSPVYINGVKSPRKQFDEIIKIHKMFFNSFMED